MFENEFEYDPDYDRQEYPQNRGYRNYGMIQGSMYYGMNVGMNYSMGVNMLGQPVPIIIPSNGVAPRPMYQSYQSRMANDNENKNRKPTDSHTYRQKRQQPPIDKV